MRRAATVAWLGGLVATSLVAATSQAAAAWKTDAARSHLTFTATQAGGEFDGQFRRFRAEIRFDPADLAGSRFRVEIETASADTQEQERDKTLVGSDFFAADRWPTATYEASQFSSVGTGQFQARGKLTIRGIARDVPVAFTFRPGPDGRDAVLVGGATIRRLDFGVGQGQWQDTQWVGNDVKIRFELILQREK